MRSSSSSKAPGFSSDTVASEPNLLTQTTSCVPVLVADETPAPERVDVHPLAERALARLAPSWPGLAAAA